MNSRIERRRTRRRRSTAIVVGLAAAMAFVGAGWFWLRDARIPSASAKTAVTVRKAADAHFTPSSNAPIFFLIIGNDERPGVGGARGDALHVLGYNPASKQGAILNIPRDTTVPIPGNGTNKINAANAFGGNALTLQTVSNLIGTRIPYVIETNFDGYVGLINDLGGIEVDVPTRMYDSDAGSHFEPGRQKLSGDDALAFARDRHSFANGDFTRTANQGLVALGALRKIKAEATEPVGAFKALAAVSRRTKLDGLGLREFYDLMRIAMQADPAQIKNIVVPVSMGSYEPKPEAQQLFADFRDDGVVQSQ